MSFLIDPWYSPFFVNYGDSSSDVWFETGVFQSCVEHSKLVVAYYYSRMYLSRTNYSTFIDKK